LRRTEERNPRSAGIDEEDTEEILRRINAEDRTVPEAVAEAIPEIALGVEAIVETMNAGGRIFFAGAGSSGRMGIAEVAEIPPTFGVSQDLFMAVVAGGPRAAVGSIEASEDDKVAGREALESYGFAGKDLLVAISASGRTPFAVEAMVKAREAGAKTVAIVSNRDSRMGDLADVPIVVETGAEVVSGSTRMKAGTAQKLVLNMLTTAAMTRLGYVHDGYMIGVQATNSKLRERAARIVANISGVGQQEASDALEKADGDLKVAVIMSKSGKTSKEAREIVEKAGGILRRALETLEDTT